MRLSLPQRSRIVSNLEIKEPVKEITVPVSFHLEKEESKVQIERSKVKEKETRTVTIRSVYRKELEEFGKYLYLRMSDLSARSHAIRVWDNLECLIDNSVDNEIALKKVEDVLIRTGYLTQESIDVKVKKISK